MNDPRPVPTESATEVDSLTLLGVFSLLRRRKLLLLLPLVLFSAGAFAFALSLPDIFEAHVLVALDVPASPGSWYNPAMTANGQIASIREIIDRRSFLEPVIEEFDLYETRDGRVNDLWLDVMRSRVAVIVEGPYGFLIAFEDVDPELAAGVVARIGDRFIEETEASQQSRAQDRVALIATEVASVEGELKDHEQRIEAYKESVSGEIPENLQILLSALSRATTELQETNRNIIDAEAERAAVEEERRLLEALGYDRPAVTGAAQDARRSELEAQLAAARDTYSDQHPEVVRLEAELAYLANPPSVSSGSANGAPVLSAGTLPYRYIQLKASLERFDTQLDFFNDRKSGLVADLEEYQRQIDAIPQHEQELSSLMRDYDNTRTRYFDRVDRLGEARLDARLRPTGGPVGFRVIERARVPEIRSGPARSRIVSTGVLLGLFVGFGLLLVGHQLDSTFSDVDDLRRFSNLSTLASIPFIRGGWFNRGRGARIPAVTDGVSVASEQYRILTLRLRSMMDRECGQILLVTSSAGGEGKTTTAVNTAFALSQIQQEKVPWTDADVRKRGVRGCLTQVADGRLGPQEGFRHLVKSPDGLAPEYFGRVGQLYVLASADRAVDSLHDVSSESLRKTLAKLRKQFKYIVIDSPPLLPMVDSHLLAELADRVVLVVRANRTRRETLARTLQTFDMSKVLGFVLNSVDYSRARYGSVYDGYAKEYLAAAKPRRGTKIQIQ